MRSSDGGGAIRQAKAMRFRSLPPRLDLLLGAAVGVLALVEVAADSLAPYAVSVTFALVQAAAVVWRRRAPLAAVSVATGAMFVQTAAGVSLHKPVMPIVVGLITVYSVAEYEPLERAAAGLAVALAGSLGAIQLAQANGERYGMTDRLFVSLFIVAPWIVGGQCTGARSKRPSKLRGRSRSSASSSSPSRRSVDGSRVSSMT